MIKMRKRVLGVEYLNTLISIGNMVSMYRN